MRKIKGAKSTRIEKHAENIISEKGKLILFMDIRPILGNTTSNNEKLETNEKFD
jgi:hypothetical protein